MIRTVLWLGFYCLCLGFVSIDVTYKDGLHLQFYNWEDRQKRRKR